MSNNSKFRVAVIGLGWWGQTISRLIKTSDVLQLVAGSDLNQTTGRAFTQEIGVDFLADLDAALADPRVEGVILCTPHTQHGAQMILAAEAGKHIFCEKPLALHRADVVAAMAAINQRGLTLAVGHERRFEPPIIKAMEMIHSGELGRPLQMEANFSQDKFLSLPPENWRLSAAEAPAGPMTATGIHLLDLSVGVFGPAETVYASVKQLGSSLVNGDTLAILATYKSGGHALISAILATPFVGRFAVYCSQGWVEVRDKSHPEASTGWLLTYCKRGEAEQSIAYEPYPAVLANLEAFADAAQGRKPYPVPQEQMLANICALEAVVKSTRNARIEQVEAG
jgi:predicted dehydrogenase